ncbi:hypothetical protein JCM13991_03130 [Thermodesulfovibrio hydrogeniphilus]
MTVWVIATLSPQQEARSDTLLRHCEASVRMPKQSLKSPFFCSQQEARSDDVLDYFGSLATSKLAMPRVNIFFWDLSQI